MEIPVSLPPIQAPVTDAPAKAGDVAPPSGVDDAQLSLLLEMQSVADEAMVRSEEVGRLTAELLALLQDPAAKPEKIAEVRGLLDLALLRADAADQALHGSHVAATSLASTTALASETSVASDTTLASATSLASAEPEVESHRDFWLRISTAIAEIENSYVKRAQTASTNFTQWYQKYQEIASNILPAIKPSEEKGKESYVVVRFDQVRYELAEFLAEYDQQPLGTFPSQEEALRFLQDAGLNASSFPIERNAEGAWEIGFPNELVREIRDDLPTALTSDPGPRPPTWTGPWPPIQPVGATWSGPQYQEWLSRKKGFEERFQGDAKLLLENFGNVNSTFRNINNIFSDTIKSMLDVDKLFLQST